MLRFQYNRHYINPAFYFFIVCSVGIIFGSIISSNISDLSSLMLIAVNSDMSIVSFLPLIAFPFFITLFISYYSNSLCIYLISFFKSFAFGFIGQAVCNTFHSYSCIFYLPIILVDLSITFCLFLFCLIKLTNSHVLFKGVFRSFIICSLIWFFSFTASRIIVV